MWQRYLRSGRHALLALCWLLAGVAFVVVVGCGGGGGGGGGNNGGDNNNGGGTTRTVSGTVTNKNTGTALQDVTVSSGQTSNSVLTTATGTYQLSNVPDGAGVSVTFTKTGFKLLVATLAAGQTVLNVEMEAEGGGAVVPDEPPPPPVF